MANPVSISKLMIPFVGTGSLIPISYSSRTVHGSSPHGESNKVRINADVCKLNGKSVKNIARKSGKHKRSKNPPNWIRKGSVVFIRSQRDPPTHSLAICALGNEILKRDAL